MFRKKLTNKKFNEMIKNQNSRCYYCNVKFDWNNKYKQPSVDHIKPFCFVLDKTPKVISCKRCNHLKWNISKELYEAGYICVNFKPWFDLQSYNQAVKVRNPIKWYQKLFANFNYFWWSKRGNYKTSIKLY
jgi:hypothetical protein